MGEPRRRLEHKIALHKAASEVRYIVIFNNGSPTEPNGVSELSLAPHHRATMLTTRHSPAEIARKKSRVGVERSPVSCSTAACSRRAGPPTSRREFFRAEMLFASAMPTHAEKNRGRRVFFPLKRANIAAFCLYDRAAGHTGQPEEVLRTTGESRRGSRFGYVAVGPPHFRKAAPHRTSGMPGVGPSRATPAPREPRPTLYW
jgi:hypothetical protein